MWDCVPSAGHNVATDRSSFLQHSNTLHVLTDTQINFQQHLYALCLMVNRAWGNKGVEWHIQQKASLHYMNVWHSIYELCCVSRNSWQYGRNTDKHPWLHMIVYWNEWHRIKKIKKLKKKLNKFLPAQIMKAYKGSRSRDPSILDLGLRDDWSTSRPSKYAVGREPQIPFQ